MTQDYTVVLGVDAAHVEKLAWVTRSWAKHKPGLFDRDWVIFIDDGKVKDHEVTGALEAAPRRLTVRYWPDPGVAYTGDPAVKWTHPQRIKMLAGFVHVPALLVRSRYWLKIDLDVVATGMDGWVEDAWFDGAPAIVAPGWGYTKPADQMLRLDRWAEEHKDKLILLNTHPPLDLAPLPGGTMVRHKRIASWCAFFETRFTKLCADMAARTCGNGQLPVPSQDGFMWYVAARLGLPIVTPPMKRLGWELKSSTNGILDAVRRACAPA